MQTIAKNIKSDSIESSEELTAIMHNLLENARQKGATEAAVSVSRDSGFSIDARMGQVETVAFSDDRGVSITVYKDFRKGSASSTDTSPAALNAMVSAAMDIAEVSAPDTCFGLAEKKLMCNDYPELDLCHPWEITPPEAIEMAIQCEKHALSMDKRISNSDGVNISTYVSRHGYANSHGFSGIIDSSRHSISCSLIATQGEVMQRDYDYTSVRNARDLISMESLAASTVERTISRLGAKPLNTQKSPVVFSSRVSSGLLSSFINAISGSNLYRKNSFLVDSIGLQLFPKWVRIYDQPHIIGGLGSAAFDGEGVKTRPNVWVEKGKICQYVLGSYSARKMGLKTSGNSGGVFNLTIDPSLGGLSDVLKKMGTGLLVTELMGQGINILTGDYSRGASGFWVENGEIQFPVEGVTIAGNLQDMLGAIVAVGSDINPNSSTRCGSVLVEEMMIAGN